MLLFMEEIPLKVKITEKTKAPSVRLIKYRQARLKGKNKEESKIIAGYSPATTTTTIEKMDSYKRISLGDQIKQQITEQEIIGHHVGLIRQDKDNSAKLAAIKMAYERMEPDNEAPEQAERVIVILK